MSDRMVAEVEQALGPGVDFERDAYGGLIGRRARPGGLWLGFDRAALVDSDDGTGRRLPVLVALPASTYAGCRLEIELSGGWRTEHGVILVGQVAGSPRPVQGLGQIAAGADGGTRLDIDTAVRVARRARRRHRERQSHRRILGGRAWDEAAGLPPELARLGTPHSAAEYSFVRLPPRFVRGLEGLLDDERLLYWIERPAVAQPTLIERVRRRIDRRAALLALSDRELLWVVDHARPDRYLSDWGVDVEIVPLERLLDVHWSRRGGMVELTTVTPAGTRLYRLPAELDGEVHAMHDLLARFTPSRSGRLPRRRYPIKPLPFDPVGPARFHQEREAEALYAAAQETGEVIGFMFSPGRPIQRTASALVLRATVLEVLGQQRQAIPIRDVAALALTLSPLSGRIGTHPGIGLTFPAPQMDQGAAFARLARRVLAGVT